MAQFDQVPKALHEDDASDSESAGLLQEGWVHPKTSTWRRFICVALCVSVLLNIVLAAAALATGSNHYPIGQFTYEKGFMSDLYLVKDEIEIIQYDYRGGVRIDENGTFSTDERDKKYVGTPSPAIDRAWYELLTGLNVNVPAASGSQLSGKTFQWPDSGDYFTGLEVFHSLHCLNRLRQALYPGYYDVFSNPDDPSREDHIGHCINHLRQALQCHADLTPMEWQKTGNKLVLNTETKHTCRNFEKVHAWARENAVDVGELNLVKGGQLFVVD